MDVRIAALDLDVTFAAREELRTELSAKFTRERLHGDLAFALTQRHADNATLHTFYHRQIAEAARRRYLDPRSVDPAVLELPARLRGNS
jgi:hypothetical protein